MPALQNRNEPLADLVREARRPVFSGRYSETGCVAKSDDRGKARQREQSPAYAQKRRIVPPADGLARGRLTVAASGSEIEAYETGRSAPRRKLQKRRIKRQDILALGARALGKNDNALAVARVSR